MAEKEKTYKAPAAAAKEAAKAIKWKEEHGDEVTAMTRVGWARAHQLAKGENLSLTTVKRMAAFVRHKKNSNLDPELKGTPWKDRGYVAWLGWGGDAGIEWAQKVVDSLEDEKNESAGAGEEGTDELLKNYLKSTPYAKIIDSPHNKLYSFSEFLKMQNEPNNK
jgi:hypothetical protein